MKSITWRTKYKELVNWTDEQLEVFEAVTNCDDHIAILACAGGGKTFTAVYGVIATLLNKALKNKEEYKIQVLAFNEHIATEIRKNSRIPQKVKVSTFHGLGMGLLYKYFRGESPILRDNKYYELAKKRLASIEKINCPSWLRFEDDDERHEFLRAVKDIVEYAQSTLSKLETESLVKMAGYYGLLCPGGKLTLEAACDIALDCIEQGMELAQRERVISYSDMIYLPIRWNIYVHRKTHVITDEFQDMSAARLVLLNKFAMSGARIILVGDLQQSIAGFSGADPRSAQKAYEKFDPLRLYLSCCFRCGSSILDLARVFQPRIMPAPGAEEGLVTVDSPDDMFRFLGKGDLVISRYNAPLIDKCLEACFAGVRAKIAGDILVTKMKSYIKRAAKLSSSLVDGLVMVANSEINNLEASGRQSEIIGVDRIKESLIRIIKEYKTTDTEQVLRIADELFNPEHPDVLFSTIHKIKGGEADTVWLLGSNLIPNDNSIVAWQNEQERNLAYVAITRAKKRLHLVPYVTDEETEGTVEDLLKHPYGGMELPRPPVKVPAPPKPGQLSLSLF